MARGKKEMEGSEEVRRRCHLLVGMQKLPLDILREHFRHNADHIIDQVEASKLPMFRQERVDGK